MSKYDLELNEKLAALEPPKQVIAFAGKKGVGKSTLAKALAKSINYARADYWYIYSFATPLYAMADVLGIHKSSDENAFPFRYVMQTLGTEWGRRLIAENIWVYYLALQSPELSILIDDMRFKNELHWAAKYGVTVYLQRDYEESGREFSGHQSENDIAPEDCDLVLHLPEAGEEYTDAWLDGTFKTILAVMKNKQNHPKQENKEMLDVSMRHAELVARLAKKPDEILCNLDPKSIGIMHAALGIAGEAGEIVDLIKKVIINRKAYKKEDLVKELGDLEFYLQMLRAALKISKEEVLEGNIAKLTKRYPDGYSDAAAAAKADQNPATE